MFSLHKLKQSSSNPQKPNINESIGNTVKLFKVLIMALIFMAADRSMKIVKFYKDFQLYGNTDMGIHIYMCLCVSTPVTNVM